MNMLIITIVIVSNYKLKALLSKNVLSIDLRVSIIQAFLWYQMVTGSTDINF